TPREMVANWLVCAVINADEGSEQLTFTSDPTGGDGVIYNAETEHTWLTEHVMVPRAPEGETPDIKALILKAVALKQEKGGAAYASGKRSSCSCRRVARCTGFPMRSRRRCPRSILASWQPART